MDRPRHWTLSKFLHPLIWYQNLSPPSWFENVKGTFNAWTAIVGLEGRALNIFRFIESCKIGAQYPEILYVSRFYSSVGCMHSLQQDHQSPVLLWEPCPCPRSWEYWGFLIVERHHIGAWFWSKQQRWSFFFLGIIYVVEAKGQCTFVTENFRLICTQRVPNGWSPTEHTASVVMLLLPQKKCLNQMKYSGDQFWFPNTHYCLQIKLCTGNKGQFPTCQGIWDSTRNRILSIQGRHIKFIQLDFIHSSTGKKLGRSFPWTDTHLSQRPESNQTSTSSTRNKERKQP